jgi:hypothetical protein
VNSKPNRTQQAAAAAGNGEVRDDDGLLVDEYSDDALVDGSRIDALDVPDALVSDGVLAGAAGPLQAEETLEIGNGPYADVQDDTLPEEQRADSDDLGSSSEEPHSIDQLAAESISTLRRTARGAMRDDQ